ncbi:SAM-dependent methyltransferase [Pullulanibacillus pueri]|uniref:Methyltransferase domain-containing protein n=1 Tax=Pullulanibacillus pueri TaxID=1437324 RepID=A0A8J2ZYL9_9BACL|nr:class I SAM-dependent methyltransferase [Pullulanibacillus pueri]MBM7680979.1 SAM-dependent methyltransferase [Pullulanibacillus pueri]GGH86207.1 hypothetical protein GCM10007096_33370 [Pullulanibacillus pueri]
MNIKLEKQQLMWRYLDALELKDLKTNEAFWNHLEGRHDDTLLDRLDDAFIAQIDGTNEEEIYRVKNENLKLSLDVANYSTNLYRSYFEWLIQYTSKYKYQTPEKVLDIGCDNGIVTCFYGLLFPQSKIIGIDIQKNGLKVANELKEKFKLNNVTFLSLDVKEILHHFSPHFFDLITSVRTFHEIIGFPEPPEVESVADLLHLNIKYDEENLLSKIHEALRDEKSTFITTERLIDESALFLWKQALRRANLLIKSSDVMKFHELGHEQHMPLLVAGIKS